MPLTWQSNRKNGQIGGFNPFQNTSLWESSFIVPNMIDNKELETTNKDYS
jgi:hypothetical protein